MEMKLKSNSIQSMPLSDRPYEKCEKFGIKSLSDTELLAIILRSGTKGHSALELAQEILLQNNCEYDITQIYNWNQQQLKKIKGIGDVKSIQIQAIAEFAIRLSKADAKKGISFNNAESIVKYYKNDMRHLKYESMILILVDTKSQLIDDIQISKGTVNSTIISPREILIEALQKDAVGIVLIHNHPSGDPTPSIEDITFTRRIRDAGELVGITLLDHIVIGNNLYTSILQSKLL